ncbi:PE-PPE domain-containing protein [Streptomyces winkii]|uniref:PE-PPE domain-containing protein n=1 Tax=Streptomyces winkii TaxID=3051178 RepID=UPI0028D3EC75|nr:PE-PPE domain-containing protein [Streptomyces sp. DSM 40971]
MRRRTLWAAVAASSALTLTATGVATAVGTEAAGCAQTRIFEVGGHLDGNASVYDKSNGSLPAGTDAQKVPYSAQIAPFPGDTISMDDSVAEGISKLDKAVRDYHGQCPDSHITISGYSQGAIVAGDELARLSQEQTIPHQQIDGVLYGDPRRPGVDGGPGGIEGNLPTIVPGITMKGQRGFGDIAVHEICNKNDGICFSENPVTNLLGFANGVAGYFMGDHSYEIDPSAHRGDGDTVHDQPPRVPHGPPLPVPAKTPREKYEGDVPGAQRATAVFRDGVREHLPRELRDKLDEFPWLSVPAK